MTINLEELQVKTRHKKKLAEIRAKEDITDGNNGRETGISDDRRLDEITVRSVRPDSESNEGTLYTIRDGYEGVENIPGAARGHDQGIRQTDTENIITDSDLDRNRESFGENQLTSEEKKERERELARQRKQRQRDREKEEQFQPFQNEAYTTSSNSDSDRDTRERESSRKDSGDVSGNEKTSRFRLKNPLHSSEETLEKVKLFTQKEAGDEKEHLAFIYSRGSMLLDDILEIIVKGHEPVQIWQLDDSEADMLADMHLDRAKKDKEAARSARILLGLYDQLFKIELIGPRLWATGSLVKQKGGLSFK